MKVEAEWQKDKRWSDRFIPEIKSILGVHLIGEPPIEEDAQRNTDLMVLKLDAVRIGCRIRKFSYLEKYSGEFTIRTARPRGTKTELQKIIEGWGDCFFYGFCDDDEHRLAAWVLGDLNVFRRWFAVSLLRSDKGVTPGCAQKNRDGSSEFSAFNIDDLPSDFIIGRKPYLKLVKQSGRIKENPAF